MSQKANKIPQVSQVDRRFWPTLGEAQVHSVSGNSVTYGNKLSVFTIFEEEAILDLASFHVSSLSSSNWNL